MQPDQAWPRVFDSGQTLGGLLAVEGPAWLAGGRWFEAAAVGDGLAFTFAAGQLAGATHLSADLLLDGVHQAVFQLTLQEGPDGRQFHLHFGLLNQCQARLRLDLSALDQNRWMLPREGALLKPICAGDRVDLAAVDRMRLALLRKGPESVRWCQTPPQALREAPEPLDAPALPAGPLLDEFGQSTLHDWPGKTRDEAALVDRLRSQAERAGSQHWPEGFGRWGGWLERQFEATGFFRTHHDGQRWWLVDPDGHPFWSAGMDCVRSNIDANVRGLESALAWTPPTEGEFADAWLAGPADRKGLNFLAANFIRAFGAEWKAQWARLALAELRRVGVNTVANWSDWQVAREAGFPYVRPLTLRFACTPMIFRDFPDVFHQHFAADAADYARQLADTVDDPALIGYFLMNEPTWGFASEPVAQGMLFTTTGGPARQALAAFLRERYPAEADLQAAWGPDACFAALAEGPWRCDLTNQARADLEAFSTVLVERLYSGLIEACRQVDPHHLNLGARYYTLPPQWALGGMGGFDVFSINWYRDRADDVALAELSAAMGRPILIGEWHFGALDAGLPASGIGHVPTQADRGAAYRVYLEGAAASPWCVGAHWFTLYDQSALGRYDGENYNIGLLDVCHAPYEPLADAALASHARLYPVAAGTQKPFDQPPAYRPRLFL